MIFTTIYLGVNYLEKTNNCTYNLYYSFNIIKPSIIKTHHYNNNNIPFTQHFQHNNTL